MPEVRQSSFALLGDLSKACFKHVKPCIGKKLYQLFLIFSKLYHVNESLVCCNSNFSLSLIKKLYHFSVSAIPTFPYL